MLNRSLHGSSLRNPVWIAVAFLLPLLLLTSLKIAVATTSSRETRTVGVIQITADTFTDLGGGQTQASGNIWLGDHLYLTGGGDSIVFDSHVITGTGTLALRAEGLSLFTGPFHADGVTGVATPDAGVTYNLGQIAGFPVSTTPTIAQIDIPPATITGATELSLTPPGVNASATVSFTIKPGPQFTGIMSDFNLSVAGVDLQAPAGAALTNDGIDVPTVTLKLPALFGGAATTVNALHVAPDSLSLGGAAAEFALPDLPIGDGNELKFTGNQASLAYHAASNAYRIAITSTLAVNLPENQQNIGMNVALASVDGSPHITGALDSLSLTVAGTTLAMSDLTLSNSGFSVQQATLTMPQALGGTQAFVYNISITDQGLNIGGAQAQFHLPKMNIGDGNEVSVQRGLGTLVIAGASYRINVSADLALNLPENSQTVPITVSVSNGQLTGTVGALSLAVAGTTLAMSDLTLNNDGLTVATARLTLPAALGGATTTIANVRIGDTGLVFDRADAEFNLPDIAFGGDTARAGRAPGHASLVMASVGQDPALSLTSNRAKLAVLSGGAGYVFHASSTLNINLPGNVQQRNLTFDLAHNAQSGFLIQGQLDGLTLNVVGSTLQLTQLTLNNSGLQVQTAALTMPSSLGGGTVTLNDVSITGAGLVIGGGSFSLPNMSLAGGKVTISGAQAGLTVVGGVYHLSAQGTLTLNLPENTQTINVTFAIDNNGDLQGTISALTLRVAGTTLAMSNIGISNTGLSAVNVTLQLPEGLGGATATVAQVHITSAGLTFGEANVSVTLPDINIGTDVRFTQNAATLSISGDGGKYLFTVQSRLQITLPDNNQQHQVSFTLQHDDSGGYDFSGTISGLTLSVAGLTLNMSRINIDNEGLHAASAELVLPQGLGGGTVTINNVSITSAGLVLGSADADIPLPDFEFGGSIVQSAGRANGLASLSYAVQAAPLALRNNQARLHVEGNSFKFNVSSTLHISLPDNTQSSQFSFTISKDGDSYRLAGTLSQLSLTLAGSTLAMTDLALQNDGLHVATAMLTLPSSIGGSATLNDIGITAAGLSIGSGSFTLPDITFGGDGSRVKVANPTANLQVSGGSYVFSGQGMLLLRLPNNSQDINLQFSISNGQFDAELSSLSLTVAGTTVTMQNINIDNGGLHVASATIQLPDSLGGASGTLDNVNITEDGLSISDGKIALPEIKIGDGSKVKITGATAELAVDGSDHIFSARGTLNLNLPDNAQNIDISFKIDSSGNMVGHLSQIQLTLAGSTLKMTQVTVSNDGLAADTASLTLPSSLGGSSGVVQDVRITKDGLSIAGGSITLPDIKIGDGSKILINQPSATITAADGGYTFGLSGQLQLRLPQNSQDIDIQATINTDGRISGSLDQLTLKLANVDLHLTNVSFNNSGLSVARGTLKLPDSLGGVQGEVDNVTIDNDGLHIGGAGATFPFPDFKLGSSSGFSVTGVTGTLVIGSDRSYKLTLAGTVHIEIPGSGATATGSISVDSNHNISGSVNAFTLTVAGLELGATGVSISGDTLHMNSASLKMPGEWGGGSAAVYNVTIHPGRGVQIGGGSFTLPSIDAGGFSLGSLHGSLKREGNGYLISAGGKFGVPGLGGGADCGIEVDVTIYTTLAGELVLKIKPPAGHDPMRQVLYTPYEEANNIPASIYAPSAFQLRDVKLGLVGCFIPIGDSGFGLSRVEGEVTLSSGSTRVKVGVTIESDLRFGSYAALRGDVDLTMATNPAEFGINGALYVFVFQVGGAQATITEADGFRATLWIDAIVAHGTFRVHAWSSYGRFHLTGSATIDIGIPRGEIASLSIPYPCCSTSVTWHCHWYGCYPSVHVHCRWCHTSVVIPPHDWWLSQVSAEFGEFREGSGTAYGFKGWVSILNHRAGFFVDSRGHLTIGNVDRYHLVDSPSVQVARAQWEAAKKRMGSLDEPWTYDRFTFMPNGDIIVSTPLITRTDAIFVLSRNGDVPAFSLIRPDGVEITPDQLPENVTYHVTDTNTIGIPAQVVQALGSPSPNMPTLDFASEITPTLGLLSQVTPTPGMTLPFTPAIGLSSLSSGDLPPYISPAKGNICQIRPALPTVLAGTKSAQQARVRFVHASPEAPAVDVLINDANVFSNVSFTEISEYVYQKPGSYVVKLVPAGATAPVVVSTTLQLKAGTDYSILAMGEPATADTSTQLNTELVLLTDDNSTPTPGKTRVRFVHLSPDAPSVDVVTQDGAKLFDNVPLYQPQPVEYAGVYKTVDPGTYSLEVRHALTDTVVLNMAGVQLEADTVHTIFLMGLKEGAPALQGVTHVDARAPARLRFVHASADTPAVDVLFKPVRNGAEADVIFSTVAFSETTQYAALAPGAYEVQVVPAGTTTPVIIDTTVNLGTNMDYTLAAVGDQTNIELLTLPDDNTPPEAGQTRVRFVHLSSDFPPGAAALSLGVKGGETWFSSVPFKNASAYKSVAAGSYDLETSWTITDTVAVALNGTVFSEGTIYTIFAMTQPADGSPLKLVTVADTTSQRTTQAMYVINQARPGEWRVKLSGDITPDTSYLLAVLGRGAPPALSEVNAVSTGPASAEVRWRLKSEDSTTWVSIYATKGPITTTQVVTTTGGVTETQIVNIYSGQVLARRLVSSDPSWVDGTLQTHTLDLSQVESGTYWIWLQAEDSRNPPVRTYAPEPIVVDHTALLHTGNDTWDANIQVTTGYRQLNVQWNRNPNPDVDGYVLYVGTAPLSVTKAITVEDTTVAALSALDPGRTYYLSVGAYDSDTGRTWRSDEVAATVEVAAFDMTALSTNLRVVGGLQSDDVALMLTTALDPYPEPVRLYAGQLPDGIHVLFSSPLVTPTVAGASASVVISATHSLPGGEYTVPIVAHGGGVTRMLDLRVTVLEPRFVLETSSPTVTLGRGETAAVVVSATGANGENDAIHLRLEGAPAGLDWAFSNEVLFPGTGVTLMLTDTHMSGHGTFDLRISGEDGENTETLNLTLNISEPEFGIAPVESRLAVVTGDTAVFALDVTAQNGWTGPVKLTVDTQKLPPHTVAGFLGEAPSSGARHPQPEFVVTPPKQVYLVVATGSDTPQGLHLLTIQGEGDTYQTSTELELVVQDACTGLGVSVAFVSAEPANSMRLTARVRNIGGAQMPAGLPVAFYLGDPKIKLRDGGTGRGTNSASLIGVAATTQALDPGETEDVAILWGGETPGDHEIYIVPNDNGAGTGPFTLCSSPSTAQQVVSVLDVPLVRSWNLVSSYVNPFTTDVSVVQRPIAGQYVVIQGFDGGVQSYYPDRPPEVNTLKKMDGEHGYWIKTVVGERSVDGAAGDGDRKVEPVAVLRVVGTQFAEDRSIELAAGWNLVSYLPRQLLPVAQALQNIKGQYLAVLGYDQGALSFYPDIEPGFNTLHTMEPLHGYEVKMVQAGTLQYPTTPVTTSPTIDVRQTAIASVTQIRRAEQAAGVRPTHTWMNFYGAAHWPDGTPLPVGTTVQALDPNGMVCGVAVVHTEGYYGLLACYGDDPTTPEDEGAQPGDTVRLVVDGQELATGTWTAHGERQWTPLGPTAWRVYLPVVDR